MLRQRPIGRSRSVRMLACLIAAMIVAPIPHGDVHAATDAVVQTLSPAGQHATDPQMALDADGDAVVTWSGLRNGYYTIHARARSATGALGPVQVLSGPDHHAFFPEIAADPKGNTLVVWYRHDGENWRVQMRRRSTTGQLSAVRTLSSSGRDAARPKVAMDHDGNALVVWSADVWTQSGVNSRIQARFRSASGTLGNIRTLSPAGEDAINAQLAMDRDGNAMVVWQRRRGSTWEVQGRSRSASGNLGPVQVFSQQGFSSDYPQVALDGRGGAVVVWQRWDGANLRIQTRRLSAAGKLSRVQTISPPGQNAINAQVAIDGFDRSLVVWEVTQLDSHGVRVQIRRRAADGSLGGTQTLSAADHLAYNPQLAVDSDGNAMVTWSFQEFTGAWRIQLRRRLASGGVGDLLTLSDEDGRAFAPQVSLLPTRNLLVAWSRDKDFDEIYRIQCGFVARDDL